MSLLPQRKKSPEEIAKLRESLGIPTFLPNEEPASLPATAVHVPAAQPITAEMPATPLPVHAGPKPVRSLKRSEQISPVEEPQPVTPVEEDPAVLVLSLKPVRSLKKSEQWASPATRQAGPPADSNLPYHRHSDDEINEIRRREVFAMPTPVVNPKLVPAHPALIGLGYVAALTGAVSAALDPPVTTPTDLFWIHLFGRAFACDLRPMTIPACCALAALLIAAGILLLRPFSRHHAAFISVTSLFVIIFGALHYFPQLRHGT